MDVIVKKVLVPIDFSDCSRKAFYVGLKYARFFDAETFVLLVQEPMATFDSSHEHMEIAANELAQLEEGVKHRVNELFEKGGLDEVDRRRVKVDVRGGKPFIEIVRFAHEEGCDLIVMGTHGHTGIKHIFLGSTAERVVRRAHCPVLIVKPDDFEFKPFERVPKKFQV
ncbi:MAG: universal stress protein [Myxococcales bacterium]|nr:universal stress protein [Myxococcales bacterium]